MFFFIQARYPSSSQSSCFSLDTPTICCGICSMPFLPSKFTVLHGKETKQILILSKCLKTHYLCNYLFRLKVCVNFRSSNCVLHFSASSAWCQSWGFPVKRKLLSINSKERISKHLAFILQ